MLAALRANLPLQMLAVFTVTPLSRVLRGAVQGWSKKEPGTSKLPLLFMGDDDGLPVKYSIVQRPMSWS